LHHLRDNIQFAHEIYYAYCKVYAGKRLFNKKMVHHVNI